MRVSALDRKVLNRLQEEIPIEPRPFRALAQDLGMSEEELLKRISGMKGRGIIRSYAASLDHRRLGFKSTLLALKVPEGEIEEVARGLVKYKEVTHCYLRQGEYNLWVVFIYKEKEFGRFLKRLTARLGSANILNLRTLRQFKLRTRLRV